MPTHRASRIRILKETSSVRAKPIPEEISKRKTALQERHAHSPINRRRHALIALLIAGAILAAVLAAWGQPAEPEGLPSRSAPTREVEPPQTPARQPANPEKSPAASASTREAKPLQAPEDQPPEQTISLPTTRAATTTTATVPTPVLLRETTKGGDTEDAAAVHGATNDDPGGHTREQLWSSIRPGLRRSVPHLRATNGRDHHLLGRPRGGRAPDRVRRASRLTPGKLLPDRRRAQSLLRHTPGRSGEMLGRYFHRE